ncbi:type I-E CRISPR-associated protein Cas6/Cse3/CasE [Pseudoramibacter faecis]|uniref:type I-E CRISPR-associated protein Cas6/Cse3/CasE n=1 Tax=Pseudoramibacter faecis TaxID=3108534 RepID=UPI002E760D02|nr:type I-E CRISPR-associated protein Cas6/Cse3/CasE [Pseudoramibacter sp. HA2172]
MFMSRVAIDTENRKKLRELSHLGAYHAWVEDSFPEERDQPKAERSRKLWRIDRLQGAPYLLVVSPTPPALSALEKYGVAGSAACRDYAPLLDRLAAGQRLRFRATLNPVASVMHSGKKRGRVIPCGTVDAEMKYLFKRAEKNGFTLEADNFTITDRGFALLKKGGENIRLARASYEGMLEVIDVAQFRRTLTEGIGRKKAYGFGLMTVIPEARP